MSLKEKLIKLSEEKKNHDINWDEIREKWIKNTSELYETIKEWFRELIDEGYMKITTREISISESNIGSYNIDRLYIDLSGPVLILNPFARMIIGGKGRIDVYFRGNVSEKVMLILSEEDPPEWELWKSKDLRNMVPFNKANFENYIEDFISNFPSNP